MTSSYYAGVALGFIIGTGVMAACWLIFLGRGR